MNLWFITFFLGATNLSLVESGCTYFNLFRVDFDALCNKWWEKSYSYNAEHRSRRKCIALIHEKCPTMLKFETFTTKYYHTDLLYYETWKTVVKATKTSFAGSWRIYNVYKKYPLCSDDGGKSVTCDYWWGVAREEKAENKDKEFCINQIKKYCKNNISFLDEVDVCNVQRCRSRYKIKQVTYKDKDGRTASFNRYVRVKK